MVRPFCWLAGVLSRSRLIMHGVVYAALKVGEPMSVRAAAVGRVAAVVYAICFVTAGIWVASSMAGHQIVSQVNSLGPSNPLTKHVAVTQGAWLGNYQAHGRLWLAPPIALLPAGGTCAPRAAPPPRVPLLPRRLTPAG